MTFNTLHRGKGETRSRSRLDVVLGLLDLAGRAGPKQLLPSYTPLDEHSTASFVNLRLRIPGKKTGLPLRDEKVQVTSGLWGQHLATCCPTWSQLPFHFCLGWNYKEPHSGRLALLRLLLREEGPGRSQWGGPSTGKCFLTLQGKYSQAGAFLSGYPTVPLETLQRAQSKFPESRRGPGAQRQASSAEGQA